MMHAQRVQKLCELEIGQDILTPGRHLWTIVARSDMGESTNLERKWVLLRRGGSEYQIALTELKLYELCILCYHPYESSLSQ